MWPRCNFHLLVVIYYPTAFGEPEPTLVPAEDEPVKHLKVDEDQGIA
jgi:hypothetical protein